MSEETSTGEHDSDAQFEKLELASNELDQNTGRIILPSSGTLDRLRSGSQYGGPPQSLPPSSQATAQSFPSSAPQTQSYEQPHQTQQQQAYEQQHAQPRMQQVVQQVQPVPQRPAPQSVITDTTNQSSLSALKLVMASLILLAVLWVGYELHQTRLAILESPERGAVAKAALEGSDDELKAFLSPSEDENTLASTDTSSEVSEETSDASTEAAISADIVSIGTEDGTTAKPKELDLAEIQRILELTEKMSKEVPASLNIMKRALSKINKDIENLEFEVVDSAR